MKLVFEKQWQYESQHCGGSCKAGYCQSYCPTEHCSNFFAKIFHFFAYVFDIFLNAVNLHFYTFQLFFSCQGCKICLSTVRYSLHENLCLWLFHSFAFQEFYIFVCIKCAHKWMCKFTCSTSHIVKIIINKLSGWFKYYSKRLLVAIIISLNTCNVSEACNGRFINPIKDICWGCIFPISLGGIKFRSGKFKDTPNPSSPVCFCNRGAVPFVPGISIGFWEPVRVIEITRVPFCLVSLGGIKVASSKNHGDFRKIRNENEKRSKSFYHIHYYVYPLIAILNLVTDLGCMDTSSYDLAYLSEVDPAHLNDKIANLMHPETFLFANSAAQVSCSVDCIKATQAKMPIDSLFWCSGCQGSVYPFSGYVEGHIGGVQSSSLLAVRQIAKMHRLGLARKTATASSQVNGDLCKSSFAPRIPKSQYRLQMTYPIANTNGQYSCNALGLSDVLWSSGREFAYKGEDFVYMLWRKRNCCFL